MKDPKDAILTAIEAEWQKAPHAVMWTHENGLAFLREIAKELGPQGPEEWLAVVTAWNDLHRAGVLGSGYFALVQGKDDGRSHPFGFVHTTPRGQKILENVRRDPGNPAAYLAYVDAAVPAGSVARSYLDEALETYNAGFDKATTVLIGCASEALVLELRDAMVAKYVAPKVPPQKLTDWRMRSMIDGITEALTVEKKAKRLGHELGEQFEFRWTSVVDMIRRPRNEVGHPTDIAPVTRGDVHALLLIFPETALLTRALIEWVAMNFKP